MRNVTHNIKNGILEIKVDLRKEFGLSKSGKTIQVGSTLGNKPVDPTGEQFGGYIFGLNVYKYPEQ